MSIELLQQNAKSLIEALYQYEGSKKKESLTYIKTLIEGMKKSLQEERANG